MREVMEEQIKLIDVEIQSEVKDPDSYFTLISEFIKSRFDDGVGVTLKSNKLYKAICFFNTPKIRLKTVFKELVMEIPGDFLEFARKHSIKTEKQADEWHRIKVDCKGLNYEMRQFLADIYEYCCRKYSDDKFDCCSHYMECSDKKKCIYEGDKLSRGCSYKNALSAGRFFYGKNRNIE